MILSIEPNGSRFVIASGMEQSIETFYAENQLLTSEPESSESKIELNKGWKVAFHYKDADDITVAADTLFDWTSSSNADIRYFSGTATYTNSFTIKKIKADSRFVISLGEVKNLASLTVNGKSFPILWKVPFLLDITSAVRKGKNIISIDVTNLWPNRMIGDEQEPDDIEWSEPLTYTYAPGSPTAGRYMAKLPEWLSNGTPRPSKGRKTVGCFKFFTKDSPLLPSGLLGPVEVIQTYGNDVCEGQSWVSEDGKCPDGLCPEAWKTMKEFVEALAKGEGNFYDGWMKNPYSAMISCNDGFRPVSFYIETIEQ